MNLKILTDDELLTNTERLVQEEREQLTMILHHLREVDLRRLFAKLKYPSLHVYAVRHLKYSDDQAYRRISAMRLIKDMPEVEEQIASGELSLTNASKAQSFFRREKSQPQKKKASERRRRGSPSQVCSKPRIANPRITVKGRWRRFGEQISFA